jgi:hypothetical protein
MSASQFPPVKAKGLDDAPPPGEPAALEEPADACDVCGERVLDDEDSGPAVAGRAYYVWTRGDETRHEEAPLCPDCAAALGLTALARWEIDEEEG